VTRYTTVGRRRLILCAPEPSHTLVDGWLRSWIVRWQSSSVMTALGFGNGWHP
jgi:hypothetical protein